MKLERQLVGILVVEFEEDLVVLLCLLSVLMVWPCYHGVDAAHVEQTLVGFTFILRRVEYGNDVGHQLVEFVVDVLLHHLIVEGLIEKDKAAIGYATQLIEAVVTLVALVEVVDDVEELGW